MDFKRTWVCKNVDCETIINFFGFEGIREEGGSELPATFAIA